MWEAEERAAADAAGKAAHSSRWLTGSDSLPTTRLHSPALPSSKRRYPPFPYSRLISPAPPCLYPKIPLNCPVSVALAPRAAPGGGSDRVGDGTVHHPQPPRRPLLDHELHLPAPAGARAGGGGSWTSKAADSRLRPARAGDEGSPSGRRRTIDFKVWRMPPLDGGISVHPVTLCRALPHATLR